MNEQHYRRKLNAYLSTAKTAGSILHLEKLDNLPAYQGYWTNLFQLHDGRWVMDIWRYRFEDEARGEADDDLNGEAIATHAGLKTVEGHFDRAAFTGLHMQVPTHRVDLLDFNAAHGGA